MFQKACLVKSGGSLVIEPTEALTVIDVNTEKAVQGKRNKEHTFFKLQQRSGGRGSEADAASQSVWDHFDRFH